MGHDLYYCPNKERSWVKNGGKSNQPWKRGTGCGFERSMNIERTDELVWSLVQDMHAKSSLLKEEVKRRVLDQQGLPYVGDKEAKKKALSKVRRLQKDLVSVSETIGNVVSRKLLNELDEHSYSVALSRLNAERDKMQSALAELKLQLQAETTRRKWIDWIDTFGSEVKGTSTYTDEQRKSYVSGIVERIDARWNSDSGEHQLTVKFRLPIVGDGIRWIDSSKKSRGYELVDGEYTSTVTLSKKAIRQKMAG